MKIVNRAIICVYLIGGIFNCSQANELNIDLNKMIKKSKPESKSWDDYISITTVSSYDQLSVDKIEGAEINFDPVLSAGIKLILFPDKRDSSWFSNLTIGYQKSFSKNAIENEGFQESEQLNIEVPIPSTNFTVRYDRNTYRTSIQALDNKVYLVERSNTTAIDDFVTVNDAGVIELNQNDTALLETILEKYEIRYYSDDNFYWSIFKESITKPWENPVSIWRDFDGAPISSIFSQTEFESYGVAIGTKIEDRFLREGISLSKMRLSMGKSDISLTDNYELDSRVKDYSAYKYAITGEIAYKKNFPSISKNSAFIAALYGSYDYHDYSKDDDTTSDNDITLGNDYQFGARVALTF